MVRCEVDGVMTHKGQDEFLSIKALNEYDPKITGERGTWGLFVVRCCHLLVLQVRPQHHQGVGGTAGLVCLFQHVVFSHHLMSASGHPAHSDESQQWP